MKLYEYEAKKLFSRKNIPVPKGFLCSNVSEVYDASTTIGKPVVIKAQVLVSGRGKAGGVVRAETPEEARIKADIVFRRKIGGFSVEKVLVEEAVDYRRELYLGITFSRSLKKPIVIGSSEGGVDIELIAKKYPWKIVERVIDPLLGIRRYDAMIISKKMGLQGETRRKLVDTLMKLYELFVEYDCELIEINPLALTEDNNLIALDARIILDDNSLYRHPEFASRRTLELSETERIAGGLGFAYVELDGDIGIIGNGAGLTMATMDLVFYYGGKPADFLDVGGGAKADVIERAVSLLLSRENVKVVLVNVLGGITRCDEVARGIVSALKKGPAKPIAVRLMGTNEEEGRKILLENDIKYFESMDEAAHHAVQICRRWS